MEKVRAISRMLLFGCGVLLVLIGIGRLLFDELSDAVVDIAYGAAMALCSCSTYWDE